MPEYRAYLVGDDGHFISYEGLNSSNDAEAIEKARRLVDVYDVELWSGARLVGILKHAHQLSDEVHALNRQIDEARRMSRDAKGDTATMRMDKLADELTQERDAQQKHDNDRK